MKRGPDISEHQGRINWNELEKDFKSGRIDYAMFRMGYGGNHISQDDTEFERNVQEAEKRGIPWGAYLYSYALSDNDVESEKRHAKRLLKGKRPIYPVGYDMEDADHYKAEHGMPADHKLVDFCENFLSSLEQAGYYVSLYASEHWLTTKLDSVRLDKWDKWVAQWRDKCTYGKPHGMWQYKDNGSVQGINGPVDMNYAYYDYKKLTKGEEDDMLHEAVVINSFADFPNAEPLAAKLDAPIYMRSTAEKQEVAEKVYVCGGQSDGLKGSKFVDLSGSNRYETAKKIGDFVHSL